MRYRREIDVAAAEPTFPSLCDLVNTAEWDPEPVGARCPTPAPAVLGGRFEAIALPGDAALDGLAARLARSR